MDNFSPIKKKKYIISAVFLILIAAITFYIFFTQFSPSAFAREFKNSGDRKLLLAAAAMPLIYLVMYSLFAGTVIKLTGGKSTFYKNLTYGCSDFFCAALTPASTGGQPAVIYYMKKDGVAYSSAAISVILHTAAFNIVLLVYNIASFLTVRRLIPGNRPALPVMLAAGTAISLTLITFCFVSMFRAEITYKIGDFFIRLLSKLRIIKNPGAKREGLIAALAEYKAAAEMIKSRKSVLLKLFFFTVLQRTAMFSIPFLIYRSFGTGGIGYIEFLCLQATVTLAADNLPVPGGVGANELASMLVYRVVYRGKMGLVAAAIILTRAFNYFLPLIVSAALIYSRQYFLSGKRIYGKQS